MFAFPAPGSSSEACTPRVALAHLRTDRARTTSAEHAARQASRAEAQAPGWAEACARGKKQKAF